MNFRLINSILSRVIMLQGILLLPSCLVGILYHEWHDVLVYLIVSICCTLFGLLLYQVKPKSSTFYAVRDSCRVIKLDHHECDRRYAILFQQLIFQTLLMHSLKSYPDLPQPDPVYYLM